MIDRVIRIGVLVVGLVSGGVLTAARSLPATAGTTAAGEETAAASRKRHYIRIAKLFAVFLVILGLGGFLGVVSGVVPIKASSGHWRITAWFLNFAMKRSVATHSLGIKAPPLDEPALVLKGAGHYEFGCLPCHGGPEFQAPKIAHRMTPHPPYLPQTIPAWKAAELFYIVKHGVKFTGMPAWPALHRNDEVWALVAFLQKFPTMKAEEYRQLALGEAAPSGEAAALPNLLGPESVPRAISASCARCHGLNGLGRGLGAFPKLAGQHIAYLDLALQAYARGERHSGIMQPLAAGLSQAELRELARYYASLPAPTPEPATAPSERGKQIAQQGLPSQRIPACAACHGPGDAPRISVYPKLAGQYADYLELQLRLFKQEQRGGTAYAHLMRQVAAGLTAEQMRETALYYAALSTTTETAGAAVGR